MRLCVGLAALDAPLTLTAVKTCTYIYIYVRSQMAIKYMDIFIGMYIVDGNVYICEYTGQPFWLLVSHPPPIPRQAVNLVRFLINVGSG